MIELYAPDLATYQPEANTESVVAATAVRPYLPPREGPSQGRIATICATGGGPEQPASELGDRSLYPRATPDVPLPQIALNNYGDPWSKLVARGSEPA